MFNHKVKELIDDFGVKRNVLIELIKSNRADFSKKLTDNSFTDTERIKIQNKYWKLFS